MKALGVICLSIVSASCLVELTPTVYIAPSARHMTGEIEEAVESLNAILGDQVFSVHSSSTEAAIEGAIVVRHEEDLPCRNGKCFIGTCTRTGQRAVVRLSERASPLHAAHELLHALGVHHSNAPANLMAPAPYAWNLSAEQIEKARQ